MKRHETYRKIILIAILIVITAFYIYQEKISLNIEVQITRNFIIQSNFDFIYEHWKEEKLFRLRENEDYKDITAKDQFDYFLKLCDWTHNQWEYSIPDPYPLSNAIDILADIRSKKTGGFCGQYSYVLADVLKSLGFFAVRYVEVWCNTGKSHFAIEVWCDQYEKWILLDPDKNIFYELVDLGIPANAYEIRNSLFTEKKVIAKTADGHRRKLDNINNGLFANFAVSLRSDLLRHTRPLTIHDRFHMFIFFKDHYTNEKVFKGKIPYTHITTRLYDLYYDCNRTRIEYNINNKDKSIALEFFTDQSMANFNGFQISLDRGKNWEISSSHYFKKGDCEKFELWVRSVNTFGRHGCITKAQIFFLY
ncbi:MAG: transglutaminase-like domain-containing protein [Thermodesulfobacteriota bacterium]|nr:transglutaminase-like domain-containing protein [Thermodesulfobacteriota bacterium]